LFHEDHFRNTKVPERLLVHTELTLEFGNLVLNFPHLTNDDGGADEIVDGAGNVIKVNKEKTMSEKDMKKKLKDLEKRLKEHKKKNTMSDGEMWEVQDKIAELKGQLGMDK
jgi:hypothetical protein